MECDAGYYYREDDGRCAPCDSASTKCPEGTTKAKLDFDNVVDEEYNKSVLLGGSPGT